MQNETTDKNAESSGKKSWLRLVPIPFTVFLTAMFYLQGKAYHAGYLVYFHLDNTQMSISTSDAMWLAYRAWGNGAAHILLTSGDWFLDMLMSILLPATIGCVVLILLLVIENSAGRPPSLASRPPRSRLKTLACGAGCLYRGRACWLCPRDPRFDPRDRASRRLQPDRAG